MVICPGGGYGGLAWYEGKTYALWLNDHGVTAFVLKYRLGSAGYRHPAMLQDAARAILGVPDDHDVAFLLGLGYPADRPLRPVVKPDRLPVDQVVRHGRW